MFEDVCWESGIFVGNQIYNKLKKQEEFEKVFQNLIAEKAKKINLIQEEEINKLNFF